ncbi:hypothetical protein EDD85DRAFT_779184 [Armillaria nabsnona]|nr:hypothetical protein EDD85DRAFT_779184 [Armillaria nabsnona]
MKLKSYLCLDESRPVAGYVKDAIINKYVQKGIPREKAMANTVLQTWTVNLKHNLQLPKHIVTMLRTGKSFNLCLDILNPSQDVQCQIPIWHHTGVKTKKHKRYGSKTCKCLMNSHNVETAGEAMDLERQLHSTEHKSRWDCKCAECHDDHQQRGCDNPHRCALMARDLLNNLMEKWDPQRPDQDNGLHLTPDDRLQNQSVREDNNMTHFDPGIDNENTLTEGIQIFTSGWDICPKPALRAELGAEGNQYPVISIAYTDGSAYNNGTADACAGAGVWFGEDDERNIHI